MFGVLMLHVSKAKFRKLVTKCLKENHIQYITTTLLTQNSLILHLCVKACNSVISFLQTADTHACQYEVQWTVYAAFWFSRT
jgi:hypothetical protein